MNNDEIFEMKSELPLAGNGKSFSKKEWKRIYGYEVGLVAGANFIKKDDTTDWKEKLYTFYKIKNKYTSSADLIHRVIYKIDNDVVTPLQKGNDKLKEDNAALLDALKMVVNMDSWQRYFGNGAIDKNIKEAIQKAESK